MKQQLLFFKGNSEEPRTARKLWRGNTRAHVILLIAAPPVLWLLDGFGVDRMLGMEGIAVAVAAVLVAIQHSSKIEEVADELRGVAHSVPTRGVGIFPRYLSEVPGLIERAKDNITILCDTPAHGAFSNTADFSRYWESLMHKAVDGKVQIKCTVFDSNGRKQLHKAQIRDDENNWSAWKERNQKNCEAFDLLARRYEIEQPLAANGQNQSAVDAWAKSGDAYVESMMAINETVLASFKGIFKVDELAFDDPLHDGPGIYFWSRDKDKEAVFVIVPVLGTGVRNLAGFHTREPELIHALSTAFEHPGRVKKALLDQVRVDHDGQVPQI